MTRNILLIQDDAQGAQVVREALSNSPDGSFHVECVATCSLGLERLAVLGKQHRQEVGGISAILVDLLLPDVSGMEVVDRFFAAAKNADSAVYEAKGRGRNNYQFYRLDLNSSATERQSLEGGLRHAIDRHELELNYQPIMNLTTGAIAGVEALIRWQHPKLGFVLPSRFIGIAEECGLIVPIGQWVLREACRQAKAWQDAGLRLPRLAVNISAVELRSKEFVTGVATILTETGFDPRRLELELTETFLMQDSKSTALVLSVLKGLGIQLALDDFGTGYSSLSYMRRFPIDALKVDQSFVRDLTTDADDASVVSAVINMAKSLHMRVVAEGVETREQRSFLEKHKCTEAQGYYFSRPLKAQAFADLLRTTALRIPNPRSLRKSRSKAAARFSSGAMGDEEL